ncbi:MAG: DUF4249 domain-containing protein [Prolixibacteraceae bacterium]|nr:DUF4249 domain-containing protein [Prolixibacteraceae bacterium]
MKKHYTFWVLFFLLFSCSSPFPETKSGTEIPALAVSSFFSPDSLFIVKIDPIKNTFNNKKEGYLKIDEVMLTSLSTNEQFALQKIDGSSFLYTSPLVRLKKGGKYKIEVFNDSIDEVISATDSIPKFKPSFNLLSTGVRIERNAMGDASLVNATFVILLVPPKNKIRSYYELSIFTKTYVPELEYIPDYEVQVGLESTSNLITTECYYPSGTSIDVSIPPSLLFATPSDADSILIDFIYCPEISLPDVLSEHDLRIELRCVSYAYYRYKTALYKQRNAIRGDMVYGAASPVIVPSNVENGTGIFAGYTASVRDTFIERFTYKTN